MEAHEFDYWESQKSVQLNIRLRGVFEKETDKDPITTLDLPGNKGFCCFSDEYIEWLEERVAELEEQHEYVGNMLNNKTDQLKDLRLEVEAHENNQEILKNKVKEQKNEIEFLYKTIRLEIKLFKISSQLTMQFLF